MLIFGRNDLFSAIEKHGKTRRKANISAAERIFLAIADGNLSDANLSDDEAEVSDDVVNVVCIFRRGIS